MTLLRPFVLEPFGGLQERELLGLQALRLEVLSAES